MTTTEKTSDLIWMDGYEVDPAKFLPVYLRFRELTDPDVAMTPFRISVVVFNELVDDGWDSNEARAYMFAARSACEEHLDPHTGLPLVGVDAIHPVHVAGAIKLIREAIGDYMADEAAAADLARRAVESLATAGWRPVV